MSFNLLFCLGIILQPKLGIVSIYWTNWEFAGFGIMNFANEKSQQRGKGWSGFISLLDSEGIEEQRANFKLLLLLLPVFLFFLPNPHLLQKKCMKKQNCIHLTWHNAITSVFISSLHTRTRQSKMKGINEQN